MLAVRSMATGGGGLIEKKRRKIPAVNGDRGEVQLPSEYDSKRGRRKIYTMNDPFLHRCSRTSVAQIALYLSNDFYSFQERLFLS